MANITVALRVRPLTSREMQRRDVVTLRLENETVVLKHPRERVKQFQFDYCYSGALSRNSNQEQIYRDIGERVLDSLFEGYNACVLAYGQSGAGKTYTMVGTETDAGLIPRLCTGLFQKISEASLNGKVTFKIDVSYMEIYNEKVRDLLKSTQQRSKRASSVDLRVREHPVLGPYVQDLSRHVVSDSTSALSLLYRGMERRVSASTHTNSDSSRSHAVFTISCTAAKLDSEFPSETTAKLHLVDLAGSERACREVSRVRLKEGANINKSLACLGNVINALAESGASAPSRYPGSCFSISTSTSSNSGNNTPQYGTPIKRKRIPFIPYRDSVLTWILKDSLGGNAKTFMIAVVSPSDVCYHETLSTLRFAQRAKRVVNKPNVNEEAGVKLIRHLREEVSRLRGILSSISMANQTASTNCSPGLADLVKSNESKVQELTEDWLQKWRSNKLLMQEEQRSLCNDAAVQTTPWLLNSSRTPSSTVLEQIEARHANTTTEDDEDSSTDLIPVKDLPPVLRERYAVDDSENEFSDDSLERGRRSSTPPRFVRRIHAKKPAKPKPHVKTIFQQPLTDLGVRDSSKKRLTLTPFNTFDVDSLTGEDEQPSPLPVDPAILVSPPALHSEVGLDTDTSGYLSNKQVLPLTSPPEKKNPEELIEKLYSLVDKIPKPLPLVQPRTQHDYTYHCQHHCHRHCCHFASANHAVMQRSSKLQNLLDFRNELLNYRRLLVMQTASNKVRESLSFVSSVKTHSASYNRNFPGETWL